jgi:tetratricopeptide (TPR) repeat protein
LTRAQPIYTAQAQRLRDAPASHEFALIIMPVSAEMRLRLRRYHEARADASRALAADPNNAAAWHRLGKALSALKRHKAAVACYDKALALAPENKTIWKDCGAALARLWTKLATNRSSPPLFDTARLTRNLETAFTRMWERTRRGELPRNWMRMTRDNPPRQG